MVSLNYGTTLFGVSKISYKNRTPYHTKFVLKQDAFFKKG